MLNGRPETVPLILSHDGFAKQIRLRVKVDDVIDALGHQQLTMLAAAALLTASLAA